MSSESSSRDVRMRGFTQRSPVAAAWEWIALHAQPLPVEQCPVGTACGRMLAEDVTSSMAVPAFDRAAMDGYAVVAADTVGAGDYSPIGLKIIGQSLPARECPLEVTSGTAVRIMTGAPVPAGADAVVPAEYAQEHTRSEAHGETVELTMSLPVGKHIGLRGEDVAVGQQILAAGHRLRPQDCGILASIGLGNVPVIRSPRVRLIVTGNELVVPGRPLQEHQIYEANSAMLTGLIGRDGGALVEIARLSDDRAAIRDALLAPGADVILISGGSSVGKEDHAPLLIDELGTLDLHGMAMRPSSPAGMGRIETVDENGSTCNVLVFLLPGNPVSCLCAYDFFAGRAIRQLGGRFIDWPYRQVTGTLTKKIVSAIGREDYCRVLIEDDRVTPLALSGASILSSTVRANGFVLVPADMEGYAPDTGVEVFLYDV